MLRVFAVSQLNHCCCLCLLYTPNFKPLQGAWCPVDPNECLGYYSMYRTEKGKLRFFDYCVPVRGAFLGFWVFGSRKGEDSKQTCAQRALSLLCRRGLVCVCVKAAPAGAAALAVTFHHAVLCGVSHIHGVLCCAVLCCPVLSAERTKSGCLCSGDWNLGDGDAPAMGKSHYRDGCAQPQGTTGKH